ncbi:hypothetical protein ACFPM0_26355 [Pseudonocardia sulfidoxydans]
MNGVPACSSAGRSRSSRPRRASAHRAFGPGHPQVPSARGCDRER